MMSEFDNDKRTDDDVDTDILDAVEEEGVVAADECHKVLDCRLWRAVGEVHQSQLFLAVCANDKRFHDFLFIG